MLQTAIPDILSQIVGSKLAALERVTASERASIERRAASRTASRNFAAALTESAPAIIAEVKKASPSKGVLTQDFDPSAIARTYQAGGAAALSVLTDTEYFQGALADLEAARAAVSLPVLRKDFTLAEYHVLEAAAHGADAILLIAAILDETELRNLRELARQHSMAALVEVHNQSDLDAALNSGAEIIGVNNRNLHTFEVALETSLRLAEKIHAGIVKVAESGIDSASAIARLQSAGFTAFLVGEHLMKSEDPAASLRALLAPPPPPNRDRKGADRRTNP
jgi:indole-3-glycerol phosphate synthase